jgi:hypothetical protein
VSTATKERTHAATIDFKIRLDTALDSLFSAPDGEFASFQLPLRRKAFGPNVGLSVGHLNSANSAVRERRRT